MALILVFSDSTPFTFPHSTAVASRVVSTFGSTYAKDIVYNRSMQVVPKADSTSASATAYVYAQKTDGTVNEIAREVYSVDAGMSVGSYSVGCLRKNGTTTTIDEVFSASPESLTVSSTSSTDSSLSSVTSMNYNGIQFSTDSACMYFGSLQQFRLIFGNGDGANGGNTFSIQYKAPDGSYQTCQSYTDRTG